MNARAVFRGRALLAVALVVGGCVYAVYQSKRAEREPQPIIGMVRRTEIRISPRISGRLGEISALPGARIAKDAVVAKLDVPDLIASLAEANAAAASAGADRANTYAGVREEERQIAEQAVETAEANVVLAEEERARATALAAKGFASGERLDQDNANLASTNATLALKKAAYAETLAGPTTEERGIADANLIDARASAETTAAQVRETSLTSPVDGVIKTVVGELGEIVRPGQTVVTLVPSERPWFTFTIREDRLGDIGIGATIKLTRADGKATSVRVSELRPLGDFATWQATRAIGDHDLASFYVRMDPIADDDDDLEPGMSIWLLPRAR
jgi:multidrug resistance efflux pump